MELLRDIIGRYLDRGGFSRRLQCTRVERAWQEALGDSASHTRLDSVRGGVATFVVDSAALLAELEAFRKAELLAALQVEVGGGFVREIKLRPGSLRRRRRGAAGEVPDRAGPAGKGV